MSKSVSETETRIWWAVRTDYPPFGFEIGRYMYKRLAVYYARKMQRLTFERHRDKSALIITKLKVCTKTKVLKTMLLIHREDR